MQVLKDEVRDKVLESALIEFFEQSFQKSSMRRIAKRAGVTVGNLYRYFKNKEELFYEVVRPAYHTIISLINESPSPEYYSNTTFKNFIKHKVQCILELYQNHWRELRILIDGSEGTEYEQSKQHIILLVEKRMLAEMKARAHGYELIDRHPFIVRVIATSFIEGLVTIFRECPEEENAARVIAQFQNFYFQDFFARLYQCPS